MSQNLIEAECRLLRARITFEAMTTENEFRRRLGVPPKYDELALLGIITDEGIGRSEIDKLLHARI